MRNNPNLLPLVAMGLLFYGFYEASQRLEVVVSLCTKGRKVIYAGFEENLKPMQRAQADKCVGKMMSKRAWANLLEGRK